MQDGATPHTANIVMDFLYETFGDRILSRRYPDCKDCGVNWPAHSPDLNPCDYFLWGCLKSRVYNTKPRNVHELKQNIVREIRQINLQTCKDVITNFHARVKTGKTEERTYLGERHKLLKMTLSRKSPSPHEWTVIAKYGKFQALNAFKQNFKYLT